MTDIAGTAADWRSHPITGYVKTATGLGSLISEILPRLWMGGCKDGVRLPDDFSFVLSLYPWEKYQLGPNTERREERLYDSTDIPSPELLGELAVEAFDRWDKGTGSVLIHCQAGLNRSGLITALVLRWRDFTSRDAIALLREKRSEYVLCNRTFESFLLGLDSR